MSTQNNDSSIKFLNNAIMVFIGCMIAISVLGVLNDAIGLTGFAVMFGVVVGLIVIRAILNKKTK